MRKGLVFSTPWSAFDRHFDSERVDGHTVIRALHALIQTDRREVCRPLEIPDEYHDIVIRQRFTAHRDLAVAFDTDKPDLQGIQTLAQIIEQLDRPALVLPQLLDNPILVFQ